MSKEEQAARARRFLELHQGPKLLLLPNAWDVASARIFEEAGFPAVATTSAGVAFALGYPDGEVIPLDELLKLVDRIAPSLKVPLSVDFEAGFGERAEEVGRNVGRLLEAGAVGLNLEDRGQDPSRLVEKILAAREAGESAGVPVVINARTDILLYAIGEPESRFEESVRRVNAYRRAGADCLFIPGVADAEALRRLALEVEGPLNVLAVAGTPPIDELERMGVRRVTVGSGAMRATMGLVQRIARELKERGTYAAFLEGAFPYAEANRLFPAKRT